MKETALYLPIKYFLEAQGYEVKSEVKSCDVVAVRFGEDPVIVELKLSLSMALLLQGVDRQEISDAVYIAVPRGITKRWQKQIKETTKLCRRLGLGLISIRILDGFVQVHVDPAPYQPRKFKKRQTALLKEFNARIGDQNIGGQVGRKIMTAYRQDSLRIAQYLRENPKTSPKTLRSSLAIEKAATILQNNYYGWFYRVTRGVYDLTDNGRAALIDYRMILLKLM